VAHGSRGVRKLATARYLDTFEQRSGAWKVAHRTLVFGDIHSEQMAEDFSFPPSFVEQRHSMADRLYALRAAMK
jgi:hypothetical protein